MKKGDIVLYLHEFGGQAHLQPLTVEEIGRDCNGFDVVNVEEFEGCVFPSDLWTKEQIPSLFEKVDDNEKPRYYMCPECKDVKTWEEILEDCSQGGTGLCDCKFMAKDPDTGEVWYPREYTNYKEISHDLYKRLKELKELKMEA